MRFRVSDEIFKRDYPSLEAFEKVARDNNYVMITEEEVKRDLEARFTKNIDEARREMIPKEDRKDYAKLDPVDIQPTLINLLLKKGVSWQSNTN